MGTFRVTLASDLYIPDSSGAQYTWMRELIANVNNKMTFVSELLRSDYLIANLEAPILEDEKISEVQKNGPCLAQHDFAAELLRILQVNCCLLANNHIMDFGQNGLRSTLKVLDEIDIEHLGAGLDPVMASKIVTIPIPESMIEECVIFNYAEDEFGSANKDAAGYNRLCFQKIYSDVLRVNRTDTKKYKIAVIHGGAEHCTVPPPSMQKYLKFLSDLDFDLIVVQHTHIVGMSYYLSDTLIVYGQGNFIFPPKDLTVRNKDWETGNLVHVDFNKDQVNIMLQGYQQCNELGLCLEQERQFTKEEHEKEYSTVSELESSIDRIWNNWVKEQKRRYLNVAYSLPLWKRLVTKVISIKFVPTHKKLKLLNYIRCMSHLDTMKQSIEQDLKSENSKHSSFQ